MVQISVLVGNQDEEHLTAGAVAVFYALRRIIS